MNNISKDQITYGEMLRQIIQKLPEEKRIEAVTVLIAYAQGLEVGSRMAAEEMERKGMK